MVSEQKNRKAPLPDALLERCRNLRQVQTRPEQLLWKCLRSRQFFGAKFRRQHPVGRFIVDFFCQEHGLVAEIDGYTHDYRVAPDLARQKDLENAGFTVLRFSDQEIRENPEGVLATIASHLPTVDTF